MQLQNHAMQTQQFNMHTPLKKQRKKNHFYIKISETLAKLDIN